MQPDIHEQLNLLKTKKQFFLKTVFIFIGIITVLSSFTQDDELEFNEQMNRLVSGNSLSVISYLDSLTVCLEKEKSNINKQQYYYERSRKLFKEIEFYTEYNFPFYSKYFINAALVNKAEYEYGFKTFAPHGFQVIESYLYSQERDSAIPIQYELILLKQSFQYLNKNITKKVSTAVAIDMMRFEIIRIMSLYLNGYDCTVNKQNLKEIQYILNNFKYTIQILPVAGDKTHTLTLLNNSLGYLNKHQDYDTFNRLLFIVSYLKPFYEELYTLYPSDAVAANTSFAINIRGKKFYDDKWLNKKYFSVVLKDSLLVPQQIELGKLLFFDPVLSGNNQRACASCHNPDKGFADNSDFNLNYDKQTKLNRNSPSLINAVFQKSFFHDGRSLQLEDQAIEVLLNHNEMNAEPEDIVNKLRHSTEYLRYFKKAFKGTEDTTITLYGVLKSLSEFERTLVALNSRFDKYLRGDLSQLTDAEVKGYTVFSGKALCGSCHFFPLFNGLVPPFYSDNEFETLGVPKTKANKELDTDSARFHISKNLIHVGAFKTTGIRNIEQTAPYMHNGIYTTVDEVIDFYKKGGGNGFGFSVNNQTLPFDSLQLSKIEISNLKKFLFSLTDKTFKVIPPKSLPYINMKGLEKRKVGGMY